MKEKKYICKSEVKRIYNFTDKLINEYLKEPDKTTKNPHYKCAPEQKLYLIARVEEVIKDEAVSAKLNKIKERREAKENKRILEEKELEKKKDDVKSMMNLYSLEYIIEKSKQYKKKYFIHSGPTNSGKTYNSLNSINAEIIGQYLGPLRLLALEIYEKLNKNDILCSLLTGEERIDVENAKFLSSTVEMCDYDKELDILIIDEAQLIADRYRGHCYTKAMLLSKAKNIHICCAPEGRDFIVSIIEKTNMEYEVYNYDRLVPLKYAGKIGSFKKLQDGDAVVVFSRRKVLEISSELELKGIKTSVIYGNLPPKNRIKEIEKFVNGESKVLVCTDAIGLGVSLPIKRIIFFEDSKYDGIKFRMLKEEEVYQIAGRAGRYGIYDHGEYLYWNNLELAPIEDNLSKINKISIPFPKEILSYDIDLLSMLKVWNSLERTEYIQYQDLTNAEMLLSLIKYKKYDKELVYRLITCPFNTNNSVLLDFYLHWTKAILLKEDFYLPYEIYYVDKTIDLKDLELYYRLVELYNYMMKIQGKYDEEESIKQLLEKISNHIDIILLSKKGKYNRYW